MERLVVDTSVVSYLFKRHTLAAEYRPYLEGNLLGLSFMSVAELYRWPLERGWGEVRLAALKEHLKVYALAWAAPAFIPAAGTRRLGDPSRGLGAFSLAEDSPAIEPHNRSACDGTWSSV